MTLALSIESIQKKLTTHSFGKQILLFDQIDSTNNEMQRQAQSGLSEGGVILAEAQSQGKGRLGRKWFSPPGVNLYLSVLLRPSGPNPSPLLSLLSAVAAAEGIETTTGLSPTLKWPNDLLVSTPSGERKIGGILLEFSQGTLPTSPPFLTVGIGINVNVRSNQFPSEITAGATSLYELLHEEVDRNLLAAMLLNQCEAWYTRFLSGEQEVIRSVWLQRSCTLGKKVRVVQRYQEVTGVAEGITSEGALIVKMETGENRVFSAADVVHLNGLE